MPVWLLAAHRCVVILKLDVMPQLCFLAAELARNRPPLYGRRVLSGVAVAIRRHPVTEKTMPTHMQPRAEQLALRVGKACTFQGLPDGALTLVRDPLCALEALPARQQASHREGDAPGGQASGLAGRLAGGGPWHLKRYSLLRRAFRRIMNRVPPPRQ